MAALAAYSIEPLKLSAFNCLSNIRWPLLKAKKLRTEVYIT